MESAVVARLRAATRTKGKNKAPPEHPDSTWGETYRGIAAAKRLKLDPKASPYIHGGFDKQSSTGPYGRLVTAQLELIKLKRKFLPPPAKGDGSEFEQHQDPIGFIYNGERFPTSHTYTPPIQVYSRDEKK
ncbi:hypothetical protein ACHAPQ_011790 [Fusarium lateritium]